MEGLGNLDYEMINFVLTGPVWSQSRQNTLVVFYKSTEENVRKYRALSRSRRLNSLIFLPDNEDVGQMIAGMEISGFIVEPDANVDLYAIGYTLTRCRVPIENMVLMMEDHHEVILEQSLEKYSHPLENEILLQCYCNSSFCKIPHAMHHEEK